MTKYERLIKKAKSRYAFLRDTFIEFDTDTPAYGLSPTQYQPSWEGLTKGSITVCLAGLKDKYENESARYSRRLGKLGTFDHFVFLVFLHEIAHVWQRQQYKDQRFNEAYRTVLDQETHDECWLEIEADTWAKKEAKRWEK